MAWRAAAGNRRRRYDWPGGGRDLAGSALRVRARTRRAAGLRRWWRRIDWGRAGTITAVVAALAGLLLTGVSTLYDSLVSQGELEQAHQAAFQETCARALRVSYWTEYLTPFVKRLHIINSSPDPVSEADLLLWPAEGLSRLPDDWTVKSVGDGDGPLGITGVTEGTPGVLSVKQAPSCGDG